MAFNLEDIIINNQISIGKIAITWLVVGISESINQAKINAKSGFKAWNAIVWVTDVFLNANIVIIFIIPKKNKPLKSKYRKLVIIASILIADSKSNAAI